MRFLDRVVIKHGPRGRRSVGSVREAAAYLLKGWPEEGRGDAYNRALDICGEVIAGMLPIPSARIAFIVAAREVGIFVGTEPAERGRRRSTKP